MAGPRAEAKATSRAAVVAPRAEAATVPVVMMIVARRVVAPAVTTTAGRHEAAVTETTATTDVVGLVATIETIAAARASVDPIATLPVRSSGAGSPVVAPATWTTRIPRPSLSARSTSSARPSGLAAPLNKKPRRRRNRNAPIERVISPPPPISNATPAVQWLAVVGAIPPVSDVACRAVPIR